MRQILKQVPQLRRAYYRLNMLRAQSNESEVLLDLSEGGPKTFIEFGFHPAEFNCIEFARSPDWRGLLIDADERQIEDAKIMLDTERISVVRKFLALDDLEFIRRHFREVGILSIDVDGNDYWFLKSLLDVRPKVISVEYNSSLGLLPITVPYDPTFDRSKKHPRGWYHGASLTALNKLCGSVGYGLAAVSSNGTNAFFTETGALSPSDAWLPNSFRARYSGIDHDDQWSSLKNMEFVSV
jgi:hypothetical protein